MRVMSKSKVNATQNNDKYTIKKNVVHFSKVSLYLVPHCKTPKPL